MKQLLILLLLLTGFSANSQCNAITINTFVLKPVGTCRYVIEINATLANGNASIRPFYSCSNVQIDLPNCFSWPTPGTQTFQTDTFTCYATVFAGIRGYSSPSCNGNQCMEMQLTNLPLVRITEFNAYQSDDQVCLTWKYESTDELQYLIENSYDGKYFQIRGVYGSADLRQIGGLSNVCLYDTSFRRYYRVRIIDDLGTVTISPVKTFTPKQNDLSYNVITRTLTIKGDIDDFTPRYLTVYSRDGKEVYMRGITSNTMTLPELTAGIYFAVVTTPKGNLIKTIIL